MCIVIINFKNLIIAMVCTMNNIAILDNDPLFFHPCLSLVDFILGIFIDVLWWERKEKNNLLIKQNICSDW